jgi:uncharacterized membrane protein YgdD (TMEM256/DUF423 family)
MVVDREEKGAMSIDAHLDLMQLKEKERIDTQKYFFVVGAIIAAIGVGVGAFGAHGLKDLLEENMKSAVFETAVRYQMYHALAIMAVAGAMGKIETPFFAIAVWLFVAGVTLFSGSLYALAITNLGYLGMITPFGGVILLLGWGMVVTGCLVN